MALFLFFVVLVVLGIILSRFRKRPRPIVEIILVVVGTIGCGLLLTISADEMHLIRGDDQAFSLWGFGSLTLGVIYLVVRRKRKPAKEKTSEKPSKPMSPSLEAQKPVPPSTVAAASQPPPVVNQTSIFISYRRSDSSDVTGRIYDRLVQAFGKDCIFKDVDSVPLGVDFRKHLAASVGQCQVLLAVIGKSWMTGGQNPQQPALHSPRDFVRIEIESAFQRNIPIIPVLVQGADIPAEEELPPSLQSLAYHNGISVRPDPDFHPDMTRLIKGIELHLGQEQGNAERP